MLFRLVLLFACAASAFAQPRTREERPERGMLAVLRRDGIMLPFAAFKGNDWSRPWPVNLYNAELPATLDAIPNSWWGGQPYAQWTAVLTRGEVVPLELRSPIVLPVCEERRLGIRTSYRSPEMSPAIIIQPFPKEGLAVTPGVRVEPIEIVAADAPERSRFALSLAPAINEAEEETIRGLRRKTQFDHPIEKEVRHKVVAQLEAWYRAPMDAHGWTMSYVEAAKRYPPGPEDEGCGLETVVSGWVQENAIEKAPRIELTARVTYCDRDGVTYMLPLGIVRTRSRQHWVYQLSGAGQEWYQVLQVTPGRLRHVVEFFGGGGFDCVQ